MIDYLEFHQYEQSTSLYNNVSYVSIEADIFYRRALQFLGFLFRRKLLMLATSQSVSIYFIEYHLQYWAWQTSENSHSASSRLLLFESMELFTPQSCCAFSPSYNFLKARCLNYKTITFTEEMTKASWMKLCFTLSSNEVLLLAFLRSSGTNATDAYQCVEPRRWDIFKSASWNMVTRELRRTLWAFSLCIDEGIQL